MKDDTREKRRPLTYFRYLLLACVAGLVISLGVAMTPRPAPEPPEPAFSEQARASALETSLRLRSSAQVLAEAAPEAQQAAFTRVVTLLTTQAKALLPAGTATSDPSASAKVPPSETAPSATSPEPSPSATAAAASAGELVAGLSASGVQRTSDAVAADGGMARLLAAVGTAQLLEASAFAGAVGIPAPEATVTGLTPEDAKQLKGGTPDCVASLSAAGASAAPPAGPPAPQTADSPSARSGEPGQGGLGQQGPLLAAALSMTVKTEAETVYGYQVALTRLEKSNTQSASSLMERHEQLLQEAEELSRLHCVETPHQEPGYSLKPEFLQAPAAGLASLEAETLPVYADLVALSEGPARRWAIAGLWEAARRSVQWGADPGAVPGVLFNVDQLPPLPDETAADDELPNDETAADDETADEQS
ncbi:ferritin-like domain-containing protein [Arthrobacter sp.]|uniref:ferritin-like domain-containing protein n=1 Tax=Arthrobacter sp. TaxID=1667 RepID=UPI0028118E89|nr:ferritin-like domain-containing protein [Arthrobacter sp.]